MAALRTDISWIKTMLGNLDKKLDDREKRWEEMLKQMQDENDGKISEIKHDIKNIDNRLRVVEGNIKWLWGSIAGLGSVGTVITILYHLGVL